jgi:hypothetical protein
MVPASRNENHNPEPDGHPWLGLAKFLMILCMAVLFFLLAQRMVRQHFFSGGYQNYRMGGGW